MEAIRIGTEKVNKGSNALIELKIARLPSGTNIHMPAHVFRSKHDGPTAMISGGLHGDEVNGIETVRRMVDDNLFDRLLCGTVIALPIINVYGFLNFSREVPDGKDVNRSFPGNPDGSLASLVAYTLTHEVLPSIDFGLDFHTGGASRTNYPQLRYDPADEKAAEIAEAFAAPFTLHSSMIDGSLRSAAFKQGKSILVYEGGEALRFDELAIDEAVKGTQRVLKRYGMVRNAPRPPRVQRMFTDSQWVRAETSGLFRLVRRSGQYVHEGDVIGVICGPTSRYETQVESPVAGYLIGHNNIPVVHKGDALFHVATE